MGAKGGEGSYFRIRVENGGRRRMLRRGKRDERDGVGKK